MPGGVGAGRLGLSAYQIHKLRASWYHTCLPRDFATSTARRYISQNRCAAHSGCRQSLWSLKKYVKMCHKNVFTANIMAQFFFFFFSLPLPHCIVLAGECLSQFQTCLHHEYIIYCSDSSTTIFCAIVPARVGQLPVIRRRILVAFEMRTALSHGEREAS